MSKTPNMARMYFHCRNVSSYTFSPINMARHAIFVDKIYHKHKCIEPCYEHPKVKKGGGCRKTCLSNHLMVGYKGQP
jgi:hypothetical protein